MVTKSEKTVEKKVATKSSTKTTSKPSLKISKKTTTKKSTADTKKKTTEKVAKAEVKKTKTVAKKETKKEAPMLPISAVAPVAKRSVIKPDIVIKGNSRKRNLCLNLNKNKETVNEVIEEPVEETSNEPVNKPVEKVVKETVKAKKEIPQDVPLVVVTPVVTGTSNKKDTSVNQNAAFFYEPSIFKKFDITVTDSDDVTENDYSTPIDDNIETDENSDIESEITSAIDNVITEIQDTSSALIEDIDSYDIIDEGGFDITGEIVDDVNQTEDVTDEVTPEIIDKINNEITDNAENINEINLEVNNNGTDTINQADTVYNEYTPLIGDIDDEIEIVSSDIEEEIEKQYDEIIETSNTSDSDIEANNKEVTSGNDISSTSEVNESETEIFEEKNIDLNIYFNNYDEIPEGIDAFEKNDYVGKDETILEAADSITPFYNIDNTPNNIKSNLSFETADSIVSDTINFAKETPHTSTNFSNIFKKFTFDETGFINPELTTPLGTNYLQSDNIPVNDNNILNNLESSINPVEPITESVAPINTVTIPTTVEDFTTSTISNDSNTVDNDASYYNIITPHTYETNEKDVVDEVVDIEKDDITSDEVIDIEKNDTTFDEVVDIGKDDITSDEVVDIGKDDIASDEVVDIEKDDTISDKVVINDSVVEIDFNNNLVSDETSVIENIFEEKLSEADCSIDQKMKEELLTEVLSFETSNTEISSLNLDNTSEKLDTHFPTLDEDFEPIALKSDTTDIKDTDESISSVEPISEDAENIEIGDVENIGLDLDDNDPASDLFKMMNSLSDIISKLENEDEGLCSSTYEPNTLLISEENQKVYLPYSVEDVNTKLNNNDKYKTIDDVIENEYVVPLSNYKNPISARFKEAYTLMREQGASVHGAIDLGLELMFTSNLNPAIITACKDIIELNSYLDCLYNNETEKFKCFNIVYKLSSENK